MPEKNRKNQPKINPNSEPNIAVLIMAAGVGARAGGALPKQYQKIAGKEVLLRTIERFQAHFEPRNILTVIHPDHQSIYDDLEQNVSQQGNSLPSSVPGGLTRQASVLNGLRALKQRQPDFVLIHDAARPFVADKVIWNVVEALKAGALGTAPGLKVVDTLKYAESDIISHTVPRDNLIAIQTPQGFAFDLLLEAHEANKSQNYTDDTALFEDSGTPITWVEGDSENFKITTPDDIKRAESMIVQEQNDIRVGSGFDVHRLEAGSSVILCGVEIPFGKSLKGHSDADVGMHALTDAILAAISAGDIGTHFPPSDNRWRGEASSTFLKFAGDLVAQKNGSISHIGVTLICEAPKISPHKDHMRQRLADILSIDIGRVSVQATTTEKLGFTGRGEGIAAQATATVRLPLGGMG